MITSIATYEQSRANMASKVTLRHLQMMKMISETGNVSDAANRIGVSQSALSHRIREAERLLDTVLFYRRNKKLVPTSAGQRLLHSANLIINEIAHAEQDINKFSVGIEHIIRIGNEARCSYQWLPPFLDIYQQHHAHTDIEIVADVSLDPLAALRDGAIDLAITSGVAELSAFRSHTLFSDEMMAVLPADDPRAQQPFLTAQDFVNETYVTYHTTPDNKREYEQLFSKYKLLPKKVIRAGVTDAVIEFVAQGHGITIMPYWSVKPWLNNRELSLVRVTEHGIFIDWQVVTRKDEKKDSPVSVFVEHLIATDLLAL